MLHHTPPLPHWRSKKAQKAQTTSVQRCASCACLRQNILLLNRCNNSLNDPRLHITRISGHKLQRFLYYRERSITFADGLQINKQEWPGTSERGLTIEARDRDQTCPCRVDHGCEQRRRFPCSWQNTARSERVDLHHLRIELQ